MSDRVEILAQKGRQILKAAGVHIGGEPLYHLICKYMDTAPSKADFQFWLLAEITHDPRFGTPGSAANEASGGRRPYKDKTAETAVGRVQRNRGW